MSVQSDSGLTNSDFETANEFNEYFTSIGEDLAKKFGSISRCNCNTYNNYVSACSCSVNNNLHANGNVSSSNDSHSTNNGKFHFAMITEEYVFDQICNFPNNESTGLDHFHVRLLKLAAPVICHSLAYICNLSLLTAKFPSEWKLAKVTPIYKDGSKFDVGNYRPISVLNIISKIIERAVHDQLYDFF